MVVFASMLFLAGTVAADEGPHGGFTATTQRCQGCHSPHRAQSERILRGGTGTVYSFCVTCHGPAGDAHTNVVDGAWMTGSAVFAASSTYGTAGKQLNGGKFSASSTHSVATESTGLTMWGSSTAITSTVQGTDVAMTGAFSCTSCHSVHGRTIARVLSDPNTLVTQPGNGGKDNYRLLNGGTAPVMSWESTGNTGATKSYTSQALASGMEGFCAKCHADYNTMTRANTETPNKPSQSGYAHPIGLTLSSSNMRNRLGNGGYRLPVERDNAFGTAYSVVQATPLISGTATVVGSYSADDHLTCTTCHYAHGSDATEANSAWTAEFNAAGDASLLRFNNRTVCQSCHAMGSVSGSNPPVYYYSE